MAGGRKLVGFSQIRRRHGVLLQVGVYARWPGELLASLLSLAPGEAGVLAEGLATRVAGLGDLLPAPPAPAALMRAFAEALAARHGAALAREGWRDDELAALRAALPRYAPLGAPATGGPPAAS
jgi:lipoate-protein ligase A